MHRVKDHILHLLTVTVPLSVTIVDIEHEDRCKGCGWMHRQDGWKRFEKVSNHMAQNLSIVRVAERFSVQFRKATRPRSPDDHPSVDSDASTVARQNWKRIGEIARRAGHDDPTDTEDETGMTPEQLEEWKRKRKVARLEREKFAKALDLQYFLEMVDVKHRYGSNLRAYHAEWKKSDTHENFFYWLDYGGGKNLELPTVSRARLEAEQVRYLSREERQNYLVKVDEEGRLCWAKNGERITTSTDYKDSVDGIVPISDPTPPYRAQETPLTATSPTDSASSIASTPKVSQEPEHYHTREFDKASGLAKIKHIAPSILMDQLLKKSIRPNTWIFVADTSFRLYVGIKQSGVFQHSSFLNGARITAAGLIVIEDGKLRKLSPLSGHYRPPTKNFRQFEKSLREAGVDMSHVSISRSYAILLGLEAYFKARKKIKKGIQHLHHHKEREFNLEEYRKKREKHMDKSQNTEKERQVLAGQAAEEEDRKRQMCPPAGEKEKLSHDDGVADENVQEKPSHAEL